MSTLSGLGNKGESKSKGKFTSININNLYKGTSISPQKTNVPSGRHGLQSLGKVGTARRMPPPAHLPSLKSENSGNDPTVNLVPTGGPGWGSKEEKREGGTPPTSSQQPRATSQSQGQTSFKPTPTVQGAPVVQGALVQPTTGNGATTSSISTPAGTGAVVTPPTQRGTENRGAGGTAGIRSWSGIAGAPKKQGGLVDQNSPFFQEEFPTLATGGDEKSEQPQMKKEEENKESQYGPGPSLRPQNVASWREGGGRSALQQSQDQTVISGSSPTSSTIPDNNQSASSSGETSSSPQPMHPPPGAMHPIPPVPGGPGGQPPRGPPIVPGGHMIPPQFRPGMMPPFMFRGFPPYPSNFPGMRPPHGPYPYPHDQRFRGPLPRAPPPQRQLSNEDTYQHPSILKQEDLKEFEKIETLDGGWASSTGEVDYNEKLIFSDDEDEHSAKDSQDRKRTISEKNKETEKGRDDEKSERGNMQAYPPREAWMPPQGQYRGPPGPPVDWQRMPFDGRQPIPGYPPRFRMPPPGAQRSPFPFPGPPGRMDDRGMRDDRDRRGQEDREWRPSDDREKRPESRDRPEEEEDLFYQRRKKKEEVTEAVERARERREAEERKIEAGKEKAREKLKILEERLAERRKAEALKKEKDESGEEVEKESHMKDRDKRVSSDEERTRTGSESSDKDRYRDKGGKQVQKIPPRMQQRNQDQGHKSGEHPGAHGGHPAMRGPPPPWAYDPRAWGAMPPWPGMPMHPQMRRRKESGGSDNERRTPEMPPFDPRMWGPYGPPPPGWEEAMRRGHAPPPPYYGYPADYDRREFDREYHPKSELDEYSGWGDEQKESSPHKEGDLFKRDEHGEEDETSRRSQRDSESKDRESKIQKDPFGEDVGDSKDGKSERTRTRSWGDWAEEEDDKDYGQWLDEKTDDYKEPIKEESCDKRDLESESPKVEREIHLEKKVQREPQRKDEKSDRRDQGHKDKFDRREYGGKHDRKQDSYRDDYDRHGSYKDGGRDGWNQGYQPYNRGGSRKNTAPVPIPSQVVRENIQAPKSNFTSLKRTHSNTSTGSSVSTTDRKGDISKEPGLPKTLEEKPQRTLSRESLKEKNEQNLSENRREEKIQQPKSWPAPKNGVATDVSSKIGVGLDTETVEADSKTNEIDPKRDYQPPSPVIDEKKGRGLKKDDIKNKDRREDDKPPVKKPRDDRHSSSRGRRSDEYYMSERGERTRSGRGRSANVREYVRGGRGRGRSGYSSGRGGSRDSIGRGRSKEIYNKEGNKGPIVSVWDNRNNANVWDNKAAGNTVEDKPSSNKPRDSSLLTSGKSQHKDAESEHSGEDEWNDTRRRTHGGDTSDDVSIDENSPTVSETSSDKVESRENSVPKQQQPSTTQKWSDIARDKNQPSSVNTQPPVHLQQQMMQNQDTPRPQDNKPPALMSLKVEKPEPKPQMYDHDRREGGNRGRGRGDRRDRRDRRDRGERGGSTVDSQGRSNSMEFAGRDNQRRGRGRGGSRGWDDPYNPGSEDMYYEGGRRGGSRGRGGRFNSAPSDRPMGGFGRPHSKTQDEMEESEKSPGLDGGRGRRGRRSDRNAQPPRFARGGSGGGRGTSRGSFADKTRGGRGRGGSLPLNSSRGTPKKSPPQPPNNQNFSVDPTNEGEEWETASESSDVATKGDSNRDKKEVKKSFSSQRPSNDRQNRRGNSSDNYKGGEGGRSNARDSKKERSPPNNKFSNANGRAGSTANGRNGRSPPNNRKENVSVVYRVDSVEHEDPMAVQNAINVAAKKQGMKKISELSDVSKPLKQEKEKKDALANIDINNFASVVVIDDQPEVTFEDPSFLLENNEGFQEVYSKKAQKNKRAQDSSPPKVETPQGTSIQQAQQKKISKDSKKLRGVTSAEQKRLSKLPPRLAKVKAEEIKERKIMKLAKEQSGGKIHQENQSQQGQQNFVIENWDNEIASGIPVTGDSSNIGNAPFTMGVSEPVPAPAPIPSVNAWDKPISLAVTTTSMSIPVDTKFDKNDQHDSGIDVSEPLNSAGSSTRSSPSGEKKVRAGELINKASDMNQSLPHRQPKGSTRPEKPVGVPPTLPEKPDTLNIQKKGIETSKTKPSSVEPIQLPPSFKDAFNYKGMNSSDIKLDFTFDAELAKLTEEKVEGNKELGMEPPRPIPLPNHSRNSANPGLDSPTAHATVDLNMKIASVKKVWDLPTVFEQSRINGSSPHSSTNSATVSISDPSDHMVSSTSSNVPPSQTLHHQQGQQAQSLSQSRLPSTQQTPQQSTQPQQYPNLMASPQQGSTSVHVELQSPQQRSTQVQQPYTSLITQPNASPEPVSSTSQMLSPAAGSAMLNKSASAVEVSVSFANSAHDPVASFNTSNVEYTSALHFSDFMEVDNDSYKKKEEYVNNSGSFSNVDGSQSISLSAKNYTNADIPGYTTVAAAEFMDPNRADSNMGGPVGIEFNQGQLDITSHSHHSEAGLIMSATELAPVMNQLSIGETLNVSPLARSTGSSKPNCEQSNVCKVKPQQHFVAMSSSGGLPASHSPNTQHLMGSASSVGMPSGTIGGNIPSPPTQHGMLIAAQQASNYQHFQLGPSTQQHFPEPARQNIPQNLFGLPSHGTAPHAPSLPPQQQTYSQHGQGQNLFLTPANQQQADPYAQQSAQSSQLQSYGNQMLTQSQSQNTIMVSSTSSLMSAAIKPPSSQNQYITSGQQQQQPKSSPMTALQYGQLVGSGSVPPPSLFVQYDPGQPINTNQPPPPTQAPTGGNQNASNTVLGSQILQHRVQSLGPIQGPNSFSSQQQQAAAPLQQTGFYQAQAQAQQSAYNIGPIQQVNAPTGLTIQGFGAHKLGLPMQTPAQTINPISGSSSQLNKSAPPFKPASQKQPQAQSATPGQPPQHGSQPNTPTAQIGSSQNPLTMFPTAANLSASLPNVTVPPPPLGKHPKMMNDPLAKHPPPTNLGQVKDALPFNLNQSQQGRVGSIQGNQPTHHGNQQTHQQTQHKFKQPTFMGQQSQQQQQLQQNQLQQNMLNNNLMQAQIQLLQSLQRTNLNVGQSSRFSTPLPGVTSGTPQSQMPTQQPQTHHQLQGSRVGSGNSSSVGTLGVISGNVRSGVSLSLREQQAKQRQDVLQHAQNFLNPTSSVKSAGKSGGTTEAQNREETLTKSSTPESKEESETS